MELDLGSAKLPFLFDLSHDSSGWTMTVHNGQEKILVKDIVLHGDTILIRMPLFDSEFKGRLQTDGSIAGGWHNYLKGPDYVLPFLARPGAASRFASSAQASASIAGTWEAHFSPGTRAAYPALGLFTQQGSAITGTFGTETGDYRFLEGVLSGDSLLLSCFDGSHAFLFKAHLRNDSLLGRYWSGNHWQEPWFAVRNDSFKLRDPDSLTFLKEGHTMADFRFPDLDGRMVSPKDPEYAGKVLMVQVMGSWCPNCMDETRLLGEMYSTYHDRGLEVLALAFEKYDDERHALEQLRRFKDGLAVEYPILYAGKANNEDASAKLPFLDHVMSYPTCIFIDRTGKVRRIRTGFYGPGTGVHYENYVRNLRSYLEGLLSEPAPGT
jgi:thiol-disulfide isomerase/thioredoxin